MKQIIFTLLVLFSTSFIANAQDNYKQFLKLSYAEIDSLMYIEYNKGAFEKAILYINAAREKARAEFGEQDSIFATSLNNLAAVYEIMGNYDKALPLYIQAIDIQEKVLGKEHLLLATSLNNLAYLHKNMENYDKALPLYIKAINIKEKTLGEEHPSLALSLNNLAALYGRMGNYKKALEHHTKVIAIREKTLGKNHPGFAQSLNNIATVYEKMGDYEKALSLYIECIDIERKTLGENHPNFSSSLNNLSIVYDRMGNYEKAWNCLGQAMNSSSGLSLTHDVDQAWVDSLKAAPYASNLHFDKMIKSLVIAYSLLANDPTVKNVDSKKVMVADLATALLSKFRNQVSNEKDKLRMLSQSNDWLRKSLEILSPEEHSHKAFDLSDQNKSVLLLQATKSEQAYHLGGVPDSLIKESGKLSKKQSQLQAKLYEKRSETEKDSLLSLLNTVNQELEAFAKILKETYPKYHKLKNQEIEVKVSDIQGLIQEGSALVEYAIGDSVVHIFLVDKKGILWQKVFIENDQLTDNIKALHKALSDYILVAKDKKTAYQNYTEKAHWFYQNLLLPILKDRTDIKDLIIITDGELGHLPFETFLVEAAPKAVTDYAQLHYLINEYNISYNYSAALWKENKAASNPQNNGQMLAMAANYELKINSLRLKLRQPNQSLRNALSPLPAARKEVETLEEKYQGFFAFDELASEKTIKENARDFAILHFATHGILDAKRPILSSLALSEDNDSIESNFWQAHEISKIELNADLVVLSACETGYGKFEKGNGIASLARAFMYAGSPALIVSLWQVNDYSTSKIMENLYDNLAAGMKKDEALRDAKLEYMKTAKGIAAHPAFWSPFIMIGKTDPVSIKRKGGAMPWIIGAGLLGLLVLGGGLLAMNRRKKKVKQENMNG